MHWIGDHHWEVWLAVAILLMIGEVSTLQLVMGMLSVGALAGMLTAMVSDSWVVQGVVAAIVAVAMLAVVRPSLARRLHGGPELALGNARVIGMRGRVQEAIAPTRDGRVVVDGEVWSASADTALPIGSLVEVVEIRGATAHVRPAGDSVADGFPSYKEI